VVVDMFSKYAHFIPLAHPYTELTVAQLYFNHIYKLHGLPEASISNRDRVFTGHLWQELFKLSDTKFLMNSSYHPQTYGQTECVNQCLESFLRCDVDSYPITCHKWISLAHYWYNTSFHTALGLTPFEVLYGYPPRHFGIANPLDCAVPELSEWLQNIEMLTKVFQQQLLRAQQRMKAHADNKKSEQEFQVNDMVYLKLQPHNQSSVVSRSN
jgi:hypothetical protein